MTKPRITYPADLHPTAAVVEGTQVPVYRVLRLLAGRKDWKSAAEDLELNNEQMQAALLHAVDALMEHDRRLKNHVFYDVMGSVVVG